MQHGREPSQQTGLAGIKGFGVGSGQNKDSFPRIRMAGMLLYCFTIPCSPQYTSFIQIQVYTSTIRLLAFTRRETKE